MPDTHGFQAVAAVSAKFLREFLRGAWDSGGPADQGTIPHSYDVKSSDNVTFGSFRVDDAHVEILRDKLDVSMTPPDEVTLHIAVTGHAELSSDGGATVRLQDLAADVEVTAPVQQLTGPGNGPHDVGVNLVPPPQTTVSFAGKDPADRLDQLMVEQLRRMAQDFPTLEPASPVTVLYHSKPAYTVTERLLVLSDATHQIDAVKVPPPPGPPPLPPPSLVLSIPVQFACYGISPKPDPEPPPLLEGFQVDAKLVVTAPLQPDPATPGGFLLEVNGPGVTFDAKDVVNSGSLAHLTGNQTRLGPEFDQIVHDHIVARGREYLKLLGDLAVTVPTVDSVQNALADFIKKKLSSDVGTILIWPPPAAAAIPLTITDVKPRTFVDSLVLAIDADAVAGADESALGGLLPSGRDLAFLISAKGVQNVFDNIKATENIFRRYSGDGHDFDLKSLSLSLRPGAIHLDGEMTVIHAILCFDIDATFTDDVHLSWGPQHQLVPNADTPDVDTDLSIVAWVITLIIGFLTAGGAGLVIAAILDKVCEQVAANIGADITQDPSFTAIAAWPKVLPKIGEVKATFDNPIDIDTEGLRFSATVGT